MPYTGLSESDMVRMNFLSLIYQVLSEKKVCNLNSSNFYR